KAARDRHPWLTLEPGQVKLTLVGSPKFLAGVKRDLTGESVLKELHRALDRRPGEGPERTPKQEADERERNLYQLRRLQRWAEFVAEVPWSAEHKRDRLSFAIGLADGGPLRLFSPYVTQKPGLKAAEMIAHAKKLGLPFQKDATVESVIAD